ncbi:MAG: hypothetical protein J5710_03965 [Treponema sp.]|nr:hypothetical protein [Treponema sp.]MBR5647315.1 hypothetical protein [Treponema sp.]
MLRIVSDYQIPEIINWLTGCSSRSGGASSGTSGDPNKVKDPGPCDSLSKNSANPNKDPNYCGYYK